MKVMEMVKVIMTLTIALLFVLPCSKATTYNVGDELNWVDPPTSTTYSIWASSYAFLKGDALVFNFNTGVHDVAEVTKDAYQNCNTSSPISIQLKSPVKISLPKRGRKYFISTLNNDCQNGQKLAILVLDHLPPPPPPPPGPPPATAPEPSSGAPLLADSAPNNGGSPRPAPLKNSARSSSSHVYFLSVLVVSLVVVLLSQCIF